jgi:hypothetical protein
LGGRQIDAAGLQVRQSIEDYLRLIRVQLAQPQRKNLSAPVEKHRERQGELVNAECGGGFCPAFLTDEDRILNRCVRDIFDDVFSNIDGDPDNFETLDALLAA